MRGRLCRAYADLAEFAAHALKPGGSLLCMTGCAFIPEVLDNLKHKALRYQWQIGYFLGGDRAFRDVPQHSELRAPAGVLVHQAT